MLIEGLERLDLLVGKSRCIQCFLTRAELPASVEFVPQSRLVIGAGFGKVASEGNARAFLLAQGGSLVLFKRRPVPVDGDARQPERRGISSPDNDCAIARIASESRVYKSFQAPILPLRWSRTFVTASCSPAMS